jgi:ribosome assembly protein 1
MDGLVNLTKKKIIQIIFYFFKGFNLRHFAKMFAPKLNVSVDDLNNAMWGDFYFNSKHKRCDPGAFNKGKSTIFVQMILENIWALYNNIISGDFDKIAAFCEKLKLKYKPPKLASANRKQILKSICMEWLPLDRSILQQIVQQVSSPAEMFEVKMTKLISKDSHSVSDIKFADDDASKVIAFIAKMVPISYRELQLCDKSLKDIEDEYEPEEQVLIGFARIYCGVLKENSKVHLVKSNYNPRLKNKEELEPVDVRRLYLMMGRNFEPIEEAHAGMIVGIWGLQKYIIKTGTLTSSKDCPPLLGLDVLAPPVVRVAVEPVNIDDMPKLVKGLKLLNQVDSCVQIMIQDTGEHVLCVLGEVHLEKCIRDLTESYAKIQLNVSKPIVQFRETIMDLSGGKHKELFDEEKSALIHARNNTCTIKIIALPLPENIVKFLERNREQLKVFIDKLETEDSTVIEIDKELLDIQEIFSQELNRSMNGAITCDDVWSLGPKKMSTCMLVNKSSYKHLSLMSSGLSTGQYDRAVINGFQTAVQSGPLCQEPMHGVCFVMQEFTIDESAEKHDSSISGIIITSVKEACRIAFQKQPQRLVGPMYNLSIIANGDVLGESLNIFCSFSLFFYFLL